MQPSLSNNTFVGRDMRRTPRVAFCLPIEVAAGRSTEGSSGSLETATLDISEGGFKLMSNRLLPSLVNVHIHLPPCYSDNPRKATGMASQAKAIWSRPVAAKGFFYGFAFLDINSRNKRILHDIVKYELEKSSAQPSSDTGPQMTIKRVPQSCNMYAVDLTAGCENNCTYCHFSRLKREEWQKRHPSSEGFPIPVDLSPLYRMTAFPETVVYLSPSSDPFAPKARDLTHELLSFLLPKGVIITISTKCIIPDKTVNLLQKYHNLIEGIAVGLTNLDDERNRIIEPNCPPAKARLEQIRRLQRIGCDIGARMDPMFPLIDDTDENLERIITAIAEAGAVHLSGTYLFTYGKRMRYLQGISQLKASMGQIREKSYPLGGVAFSVSLATKQATYEKMSRLCKQYGVKFSTCGCKDIALQDTEYPLICRNLDYYKDAHHQAT